MKVFVEERTKATESGSSNQKEPSVTDKPAITDKQGCSAILAVFDTEPKDSLVKPAYAPAVSFVAEAVHVLYSPVGEQPEGAEGGRVGEGEGEEDDIEAGTNVPGATPSEVSAFSSDAKPVDAASSATEPSLFGDDPVIVSLALSIPVPNSLEPTCSHNYPSWCVYALKGHYTPLVSPMFQAYEPVRYRGKRNVARVITVITCHRYRSNWYLEAAKLLL
ncbi:hypothetical protein FRC10_001807, partial [Ceratobasidium sp. 414]